MESEFPSNSKSSRPKTDGPTKGDPKEKKVEKVTTGTVVRRKKPFHKRVAEKFTGGEDAGSVFEYVFFDIIVEAGKDIMLDAFNAGLERKFYGEVRSAGRRGYSRGRSYGRTDYRGISSGSVLRGDPRGPEPRMSSRARATHDFDEIILPTRVEANAVLDVLFSMLERFEIVTVADLYDAVGEPSTFQDNKWGWTDLRGADSERVRDGYLLMLPRPQPID
jgi:hypothetical protein